MGHCPPELLRDVADVVAQVRSWDAVVEKTAGVFYLRREPFLHFHLLEGGRRRADVKGTGGWNQIDLPCPVGAAPRRALLREIERHYRERLGPRQPSQRSGPRLAATASQPRARGGRSRSPSRNRQRG
jgi:hypothetical protein